MSGIAHDNLQNLWNYAQQNYSKAHLHDLEKQQSNRQISHSENTQEMVSLYIYNVKVLIIWSPFLLLNTA